MENEAKQNQVEILENYQPDELKVKSKTIDFFEFFLKNRGLFLALVLIILIIIFIPSSTSNVNNNSNNNNN